MNQSDALLLLINKKLPTDMAVIAKKQSTLVRCILFAGSLYCSGASDTYRAGLIALLGVGEKWRLECVSSCPYFTRLVGKSKMTYASVDKPLITLL